MFMGTPDFAVGCMKAICEKYEICACVSQPDRPKGRGHKMQKTPVHEFADSMGITVYQPEKIKNGELADALEHHKPDVIVAVAYGKILPEYILNYPKYGCINVHASLLPKYRGAAPIQHSIINGESVTGVTTMYMEKGLDTGDMILKKEVEITPDMTGGVLHDLLMEAGGKALAETLSMIESGNIKREKQDDSQSSYAPMIDKNTALIDWRGSAQGIVNLIRAMNPYPYAYTFFNGKIMKIGEAALAEGEKGKTPGTIVSADKSGIKIICGNGAVIAKTVQFEGKKMMSVSDYLSGHNIDTELILG